MKARLEKLNACMQSENHPLFCDERKEKLSIDATLPPQTNARLTSVPQRIDRFIEKEEEEEEKKTNNGRLASIVDYCRLL